MRNRALTSNLLSALTVVLLAGVIAAAPLVAAQNAPETTVPAGSLPASGSAACDPAVRNALENAGRHGTTRSVASASPHRSSTSPASRTC